TGVSNPTAFVDAFVGTSGTSVGGPIDTFPGADVPFGMVQWSPDTPSQNAGGGYEYGDHEITGLSLTHLSGPGCNVFGDFGFLPTVGNVADPANAKAPFAHESESASPGWYAVTLGNPGVRAELTVSAHTGLGQFTFPPGAQSNILINASSNQAGVTDASVRVDSPAQISGSASSGYFCGMADRYTVYFVARFDRPFVAHGTWRDARVAPNSSSSDGPGSGVYARFDTTRNPVVRVKVGLSFVDAAGAVRNLDAENRDWDIVAMRNHATELWHGFLRRIDVRGGATADRRTFYSALYHVLLHPNVISDADGRYAGFDNKIHRVRAGHTEYANYSDWDVYRTEIPLLALIAPGETSDMMQSLVDAYQQEGWLPRWALVNGPTSVMGGDSIVPVIAGAYAFGARDFDTRTALKAMVKGATTTAGPPGQGWYIERWELDDDYVRSGYLVNTHTTSVAAVPNGASETLEYALDDFSISRFAAAIGNARVAAQFAPRGDNWATLFDTAKGEIAGRDRSGAFMNAPITENGQSGFQEGNSAQYTWMVPQNLRGLADAMGGNAAAVKKLDTFFTQLNADQDKPYAWLGNEVSLGSPWVYDSLGEPWRTQEIVRRAMTTLYGDTPMGIPGNDDLGTMSAWYIWSAIGLYPQNPAVRGFAIDSPLFPSVRIDAPAGGPSIDVEAPLASPGTPYVQSLRMNGKPYRRPWVALTDGGATTLDFVLGATPNTSWGSAPGDAPPSYPSGRLTLLPATSAQLTATSGSTAIRAGATAHGTFTVDNSSGTTPVAIAWHATVPNGLTVTPDHGTLDLAAGEKSPVDLDVAANAGAAGAGYYDVVIDATTNGGAKLQRATLFVRVAGGSPHAIAYAENRFGNTVTPVDEVTGATGPEIPTGGEEPRDAALGADGKRLFVTNAGSASIGVIDTQTEKLVTTLKVGQTPNGIHLGPDGRTMWFANNDDGTIQSIDVATLHLSGAINVGRNPRDLAISPDGSTIYVSCGGENAVIPVDTATRTPGAPIAVGRRPAGIAMTPNGKRLLVVDTASNAVTPIDLTTKTARAEIPVGVMPMLVAISPDGALAYVSDYANSTVTPIDVATLAARPPLTVGGAPYGVAFTRDGKTALAIARRDNALAIVDVATGRASPEILLGNGPYTIAAP
ncbi:MAG: GH92 family glycosyl hydrolase, partial [Candidatus Eremiobacteraeota bacterium]|nr:GH92 family glycosyl hydrolase [Candidatus Eremiobacteraeota bacterium]